MATNETVPAPSKGTEFSFQREHSTEMVDVFRGPDGDWYSAPRSNAVDVRTGYRLGRWAGPQRWTPDDAARFFGMDLESEAEAAFDGRA
jgi:hypothetical protein